MNTALVVAAHPDDEVLGCGGTIARLADEGWAVHILILSEGATSRDDVRDRDARAGELSVLAKCAQAAADRLGAASLHLEDFPDNRMDGCDLLDIVKRIEAAIDRTGAARLLTHSASDVNVDHRMIHDAAIAATRPKPGAPVRELWFFEVPSSTEWRPPTSLSPFSPTLFVDITTSLDRKLAALDDYAPEMAAFPHPRSVEAVRHLAGWRGATVGARAAEAFEVGRIII
ncbi:MAG TPA: PIG-L deacetylase family protein [Allosphingosinicella sp.]|nr:PIG-L deacetylase family protein [Allosphingosinicella sp.]